MSDVRKQWEKRAVKSNSLLSGVLFQGLSERANSVLHDWHAWVVREVFLPKLAVGARVLDLGCGYGRLSKIIAAERPDIQLVGQDLALAYCRMFAKAYGPCALADATKPPFVADAFDGIISITCLMYVPRTELAHTLETLRSILRLGGVFLSVDPGYELQHLIARMRRDKSHSATGGQGFSREEYRDLFEQSSFVVAAVGGNPCLSTALIVPGVAKSNADWVSATLARLGRRDCRTAGYSRFALHRWIMAENTEL